MQPEPTPHPAGIPTLPAPASQTCVRYAMRMSSLALMTSPLSGVSAPMMIWGQQGSDGSAGSGQRKAMGGWSSWQLQACAQALPDACIQAGFQALPAKLPPLAAHLQLRGLAGAVDAHEPHTLALLHLPADVAQHLLVLERDGHLGKGRGGAAGSHSQPRGRCTAGAVRAQFRLHQHMSAVHQPPPLLTFSSLMPLPMPEAPERPLPARSVDCVAAGALPAAFSGAAARATMRQPSSCRPPPRGSAACC